ncbi:hypothetical protein pdam_00021882, partial [Pocillopora damicornis]
MIPKYGPGFVLYSGLVLCGGSLIKLDVTNGIPHLNYQSIFMSSQRSGNVKTSELSQISKGTVNWKSVKCLSSDESHKRNSSEDT